MRCLVYHRFLGSLSIRTLGGRYLRDFSCYYFNIRLFMVNMYDAH